MSELEEIDAQIAELEMKRDQLAGSVKEAKKSAMQAKIDLYAKYNREGWPDMVLEPGFDGKPRVWIKDNVLHYYDYAHEEWDEFPEWVMDENHNHLFTEDMESACGSALYEVQFLVSYDFNTHQVSVEYVPFKQVYRIA